MPLRTVTVTIGINYVGTIPSSLAETCAGLVPLVALKLLINGTQASTISLYATAKGSVSYLPNVSTTTLLAALGSGAAVFTFSIDNETGVVAGYGATTGAVTVLVEVTY